MPHDRGGAGEHLGFALSIISWVKDKIQGLSGALVELPARGLSTPVGNRGLLFLGAAAVSTLVAGTLVPAAHANGRIISYARRLAGPYEVAMGTSPQTPVVGNLHLSITVTEASTGMPVQSAEVSVAGVGPGSEAPDVGPFVVVASPATAPIYEANIVVDRLGAWEFTISVRGHLGDADAVFDVDVRKISPLMGILTIAALLALLATLGMSLRAYVTQSARKRSRKAS